MGNIILILGLLMPGQGHQDHQPEPAKTNVKVAGRINKGMTTKQLIESWGKPTRVDTVYNYYSGKMVDRFYYEDEPCVYHFKSCTVDVDGGKVATFNDVKPELWL